MRCLLFGATGAAGTGVLEACLAAGVEPVVITRRPTGKQVREIVCSDFSCFDPREFRDVDACFFCLGISAMQEPDPGRYRVITHDFAMAAARALGDASPDAVFHFISGAGTNAASRMMWARIKGETERDLQALGTPPVVCWRPGYIHPIERRKTLHWSERITRLLYPLFKGLESASVRADDLGFAIIQAQREGIRGGIVDNRAIRALADRYRASELP
ncbi:MAG: Rossmann-fold NAD(P)-binding domain-containing protein [Planctomycetota bacterium]|jgi:uncharacterized protein YbjT (DUF2867 family)